MKLLRADLFDLNPHREIQSVRIGEGRHHLLIIDNLFRYPRDISKLMDDLHYTDSEEVREAAPTFRCSMLFPNRDEIYRVCFEQHFKVYQIKLLWEQRPSFDRYFDGAPIINPKSCAPHVDVPSLTSKSSYAFVIYMNEQNIHGGTQFLRHTVNGMETSLGSDEAFAQPTTVKMDTPWDYEPLEWQQYFLAPMKFNRLVSYRNNLLHSMYTNGSFYRDTPRKTIVSNF